MPGISTVEAENTAKRLSELPAPAVWHGWRQERQRAKQEKLKAKLEKRRAKMKPFESMAPSAAKALFWVARAHSAISILALALGVFCAFFGCQALYAGLGENSRSVAMPVLETMTKDGDPRSLLNANSYFMQNPSDNLFRGGVRWTTIDRADAETFSPGFASILNYCLSKQYCAPLTFENGALYGDLPLWRRMPIVSMLGPRLVYAAPAAAATHHGPQTLPVWTPGGLFGLLIGSMIAAFASIPVTSVLFFMIFRRRLLTRTTDARAFWAPIFLRWGEDGFAAAERAAMLAEIKKSKSLASAAPDGSVRPHSAAQPPAARGVRRI